MKTVKTFNYNEIFAYNRNGERLVGRVQDLLKEDHVIHTFYSSSSGSTRGEGQTAIFFDEDILNLPNRIGYFNISGGPDLPMEFILVPIEYNGQQYDAGITVAKLNNCFGSAEREELKQVLPKYFSDKPDRKLGFFSEGITTNFMNRSTEIQEIMNDTNLSVDEKAQRLFGRTNDYLSRVQGLCYDCRPTSVQYLYDHNYLTPEFRHAGEENQNEAYNNIRQQAGEAEVFNNNSGKRTLFLIGRRGNNEPGDLNESWEDYVIHREVTGDTVARRAINWGEHLKSSVSYLEDHGFTQEKPKKKLGFFNEDMNMKVDLVQENTGKVTEEYEEIHVNSGQSWKVKTRGENCYKVKVLLPTRNNRFNTFRGSVVHQTPGGLGAGYQEACFLTQQEAEEFIQRHNLDEEYPSRYGEWYAYPARVDLNLIKVPLESGEEIHIRTECLPRTTTWGGEDDPAGIEWGDKVRRLFPRYFSTEPQRRLGFFDK